MRGLNQNLPKQGLQTGGGGFFNASDCEKGNSHDERDGGKEDGESRPVHRQPGCFDWAQGIDEEPPKNRRKSQRHATDDREQSKKMGPPHDGYYHHGQARVGHLYQGRL